MYGIQWTAGLGRLKHFVPLASRDDRPERGGTYVLLVSYLYFVGAKNDATGSAKIRFATTAQSPEDPPWVQFYPLREWQLLARFC
jgi:hypothetical protein